MMMFLIASALGTVIESYKDASFPGENLRAETVGIPEGLASSVFVDRIIEAEGSVSWSKDYPEVTSRPGADLAWKDRLAANGQSITVYYGGTAAPAARHVCIIRRDRGGITDTHWAALRWCAAGLGVKMPEKRPPPMVAAPSAPRSQ